jgi:hypothetical protein
LALGTLASFFVAPYARHYDFPVLVIPLVVLLGGRLSQLAGTALLMAVVALPYAHFLLLPQLRMMYGPDAKVHGGVSFLWVPALLTVCWLASRGQPEPGVPAGAAPGR